MSQEGRLLSLTFFLNFSVLNPKIVLKLNKFDPPKKEISTSRGRHPKQANLAFKSTWALWALGPGSLRLLSALQDTDTIKASDKICRQLIYHLTPHSRWLRQSMSRRKSQAW